MDTEVVFFKFSGAQKSIPRNRFRQLMKPGGPVYDNPIPTRFLAPTDRSKIPAQVSTLQAAQRN